MVYRHKRRLMGTFAIIVGYWVMGYGYNKVLARV